MIYVVCREIEFIDGDNEIEDVVFATTAKEKAEEKVIELNDLETRKREARKEFNHVKDLGVLPYPEFNYSFFREIFTPWKEKELRAAFEKARDDWKVKFDAKRQEIATKFDVDVNVLIEYDEIFPIKEFEDN